MCAAWQKFGCLFKLQLNCKADSVSVGTQLTLRSLEGTTGTVSGYAWD
jgi:hypothetical protein